MNLSCHCNWWDLSQKYWLQCIDTYGNEESSIGDFSKEKW